MSKTAVITARLDPETLAGLDEIAARQDRSRAWLVARAVCDYVSEEAAFQAFVQEGIDSADKGEMISHDDVFARVRERRASRIAAE